MTKFNTPFKLFGTWFEEAKKSEIDVPEAMCVSSVGANGAPSSRMVLLKEWSEDGFVFYTNFESRKGLELLGNNQAAFLFHWKSLKRQVRIEGKVKQVSDDKADAYFASRPREAQIGAWASQQSRTMETRFDLEKEVAKAAIKFGVGKVPRPPHWTGWSMSPTYFEFWQDKKFRLHERRVFRLATEEKEWGEDYLYP